MIWRMNCLNLRNPFESYDIDETNQTVIENGQTLARGLKAGVGVINPKIIESINQVGLPNVLSEIKDVMKNPR